MQEIQQVTMLRSEDFTIMENGEAYISQKKLAEKCGIERTALTKAISRKASFVTGWNLNEINQIHADSIPLVTGYYAQQGYKEAAQFLMEIAKAGARAWVYHEAGYTFNVVEKSEPMDELTILERSIRQIREQRERLTAVEKTVEDQAVQLEEVNDDIAMVVKEIEGVKKLVLDSSISLEEIYADENAFFEIGEVATVLIGSGYFAKEKDFRRYLLDKKLCYKKGDNSYHPMAPLVKHKYMKPFLVKKGYRTFMATYFTPRGVSWIVKRLQSEQQTELDLGYVDLQNASFGSDTSSPTTVVRGF